MGKASKCFSSFLTGKREKESQPTLIPLPSTKEKKRWSFRISAANGKELSAIERSASAPCTRNEVSECEIERTRHAVAVAVATAAAADAAMEAAQQAAAVVKLRAVSNGGRTCRVLEEVAAVKIQAYFRSYLDLETKKFIGTGHEFGGFYYLDENSPAVAYSTSGALYDIHCRLGHPCLQI